jgi:hypothetical protein
MFLNVFKSPPAEQPWIGHSSVTLNTFKSQRYSALAIAIRSGSRAAQARQIKNARTNPRTVPGRLPHPSDLEDRAYLGRACASRHYDPQCHHGQDLFCAPRG